MRNIQKLIVFTLLTFVFSCSNDDVLQDTNNDTNILSKGNGGNNQNNKIQFSQSNLIVKYKAGTSSSTRDTLRQIHGVFSFEECKHCPPDEMIEMWNFGGPINIEPKKQVMESPTDPPGQLYPQGEGIEDVDYEFKFMIKGYNNNSYTSSFTTDYADYVKEHNSGITVAVIDTGIDVSLPVFSVDFLYDADEDGIEGVTSGWDFLNNDHDPFDDNPRKHGTIIAEKIHSILTLKGVPHQILPIKAFDVQGVGSYFDVVCATNHAVRFANIINMSFGWPEDTFGDFADTIFSTLISSNPQVMFVASAGNEGVNNDTTPHFPSSYPQANISAVAASNQAHSNIAWFSNYGPVTVDYFASGYSYFLGDEVYGTSFSAPVVAAEIADIMNNPEIESENAIDIIDALEISGTSTDGFSTLKPVKYDRHFISID